MIRRPRGRKREEMSMKIKNLLRALSLLVLLTSFIPLNHTAYAAPVLPPVDMFQLPWDQGLAWVAIDGIDNGSKRPDTSSHNYYKGGAIDFAPKNYMVTGEDTSNFWVAAAAAGTVIEVSGCHLKIAHANGWITEYQFLAKVQVKLGEVVARNQRLGIIADGVKYRYCPGYEEPNKPHLHFILRPSLIGVTFAGWELRYSLFWNSTTFRKGTQTLGLYKPLLNVFDTQPTATPTVVPSSTSVPPTITPTITVTPPSGPYVSTTVNLQSVDVGGLALATVSLNNVPAEGYTSAEFTCTYNASLVEVSNVVPTNLFGADVAILTHVPQTGSLIVAIAGSHGNKATTSGAAFTFDVKGLQAGQTALECTARVSKGDNVLTGIPSVGTSLSVLGALPTPTFVQSSTPIMTPTISPTMCNQAELTGYVNVPPGSLIPPGATFTQSWGLRNIGWCTWTPAYQFAFFSGEQMSAPLFINMPYDIAPGQLIILSVNFTAPVTNGHYTSLWKLRDASGAQFGVGASATDPLVLDIVVSDVIATPTGPTPTPIGTPTLPASDWLTYINPKYGFQFNYPKEGTFGGGMNDNYARIDLPFVQGTNLSAKYLEVIVAENATTCQSPLPTNQPSETVTINGISFLKQTGAEGAAGSLYQWVAYSTLRDNVCVSLDFILRSHDPGNFSTPPPVFDFAAESAVFGQIVSTYTWFAISTATPGFETPLPVETSTSTPTPAQFPTASPSPTVTPTLTPTASPTGMISGQVIASKPVTISVYGADNALIASVQASLDNSFAVTLSAGTYTVVASASGFLNTQGSFSVTSNLTSTLPTIALLAGDVDNNNEIDQLDAMTVGMSYNTAEPPGADLNNDNVINVLDLELLARNYRKTGPVVWE